MSNSSMTIAAPSDVIEIIFFTPSTEAKDSSIGSVIRESISSGPAPG